MQIIINGPDLDEPETYPSLDALKQELAVSASDEYAADVIARIESGETQFTVPNGDTHETYTIQ